MDLYATFLHIIFHCFKTIVSYIKILVIEEFFALVHQYGSSFFILIQCDIYMYIYMFSP